MVHHGKHQDVGHGGPPRCGMSEQYGVGSGPLTALAFRAPIDQPERFRKSREVGAHLGLAPGRYQSHETDLQGGSTDVATNWRERGFTKRRIRLLIRSKKWCLAGMSMKIAKHRGMARPRVAVARKLATILHRVWIDDAEFRFGHEPAATPDVKMITVVAA